MCSVVLISPKIGCPQRTAHLGTVVAADEKEAIAVAIKQFDIEPVRRNRITVTKISNRDDD
jgi:hypothetical protein